MKKIVVIVVIICVFLASYFVFQRSSVDSGETSSNYSKINSTILQPNEVVEQYTNATLGTLPNSSVNYDKAKIYLNDDLRRQFTDDSFVPRSYGIQQGPDDVSIELVFFNEDEAKVIVEAYYNKEVGLVWLFNLEKENNQWKISTIEEYQP